MAAAMMREAPEDAIITRLEESIARQHATLSAYAGRRRYVVDHRLLPETRLDVHARYQAGAGHTCEVIDRKGPREIEKQVFWPLIEAERRHDPEQFRAEVEFTRRNYRFEYLHYDATAGAHVFAIEPRTANRYLMRGRIWVDAREYAVQRAEGEPAVRPSAWVSRTHFVHEYARFGEFWLQVKHHSEVTLVMFGRARLEIDYYDYTWDRRIK